MPMQSYTTRAGDTFSAIAKQFGFGDDWQPILEFNIHRKILKSRDVTKLPTGATIGIPRTAKEYDEAIQGLQALQLEVEKDIRKSTKELESYQADSDRTAAYVDIAADIAFAAKGAVKAGIKLGPRYANYVIRKEVLQAAMSTAQKLSGLSGTNEGLVVKHAGKAAIDQSIMIQAKRAFDSQKARENFSKGMGKSMAKKAIVVSAKAVAPVEMANGIGDLVDTLCDVALKVGQGAIKTVEAIAPSKVAKGFVWVQSGEHPDDTNTRMKKFVQSTGQQSAARLQKTISQLQMEKKAVYGS